MEKQAVQVLPPPAKLQLSVSAITEWLVALATGSSRPNALASPGWSTTEWRYARVIAHIQGIAPLLNVRGAGLYGDEDWRTFLTQQYFRNAARNARILERFDRIQADATGRGIPLLPLKGVWLLRHVYDDHALRPMSDIDLFTPAEHEAGVCQSIESVGFRQVDRLDRHRIFVLPPNTIIDLRGEHPDNPIKLELHTRLYDNVPREEIDLTPLFAGLCQSTPAQPPSFVDVFVYAILHATDHMMKRTLRFITLHDLLLLSQRLLRAEWDEVQARLGAYGGAWWAYPPLKLLQRYVPDALAPDIAAWLETHTTGQLRQRVPGMTMTEVSFCNLRPAYVRHLMLWARDWRETVQYASERLLGTGRMGWETNHHWVRQSYAFSPVTSPYRRLIKWLSPGAYRAGVEELFG